MKLLEAIEKSSQMRPNAIETSLLKDALMRLEGHVCELMGLTMPTDTYPEDKEMLVPFPYDEWYVYYLCAFIDMTTEDTQLYANDFALSNEAERSFKAYYRRQNNPNNTKNWRTI